MAASLAKAWKAGKAVSVNAFILAFVLMAWFEGMQPICAPQAWLQWTNQRLMRRLGIHQGYWSVFTPVVDRASSTHIHITFKLVDGKTVDWETRDWLTTPVWRKFVSFREIQYGKSIATSVGPRPSSHFAAWVARELKLDRKSVRQVKVVSQVMRTPEPWPDDEQPLAPDAGLLESVLLFQGALP